ncbi:hypothetical protein B0A54_16989 [Friedmanniomyces endolithicus]|uniref:Protein phosphatase 4 core regulatory subunit R2 n=1 Tax=Friedmanniomyces endolithicus TaxID=329885 RepID=A0A4U0TWB6_9PEZI|nr:hypothetical protein LTS09_015075 [Friedmanniomyces endolithicus]KAK0302501.1 hypothetical protein LTR01_008695 [Friedmanniomyces endolithicus]KAK0823202.1 hypothetical protein LTR73_008727 [Friedmanniomyces endolithicus]TKA26701.1 hypothetical protein B0A54_16989 [Friedmanniomyces endolithicus]
MSVDTMLAEAARDGSIDITEWPRVLEDVLQKLHDIVHTGFPIPSLPLPAPFNPTIDPEVVASTPPPVTRDHDDLPDADENDAPPNSQSSTKENDEPTDIAARRIVARGFEVNHAHQPVQPPDTIEAEPGTLPPDLLSLYQSSTRVLERDFSQSPPYTIQRLAELVLYPRKHYRFLPAYLRALDRTVSVTSPHSEFPLPSLTATVNGGFLTNGDGGSITEREGLGSDESLGGALLTPIPWLRNGATSATTSSSLTGPDGELRSERPETISGPHGAGSIETVSVTVNGVPSSSTTPTALAHTTSSAPASPTLSEQSDASTSSTASQDSTTTTEAQLRQQGGVTQGELMRQEQEAGVVPVSQVTSRRSMVLGDAAAVAVGRESAGGSAQAPQRNSLMPVAEGEGSSGSEETPHARGPAGIGMEDMGPQQHPLGGGGAGLDMEAAVGRPSRGGHDQQQTVQVSRTVQNDAVMKEAAQDDAGAAGKDPQDVEKEAERSREEMLEGRREEAKDADGDVVVADADGRAASDTERKDGVADLSASDGAEAASR